MKTNLLILLICSLIFTDNTLTAQNYPSKTRGSYWGFTSWIPVNYTYRTYDAS